MHDRSRRRPVSALALAAAAAVVASPAPAGVPLVDKGGLPYRWDLDTEQPNVVGGEVTYFVDTSDLLDTVQGPKSAAQAVQDGVRAWEVATTRIRFRADTSRPAFGRNGNDRVNWIGWSQTELGPATFAATFPTRTGSVVTDMDVVLNDRSFFWNTVGGDGVDGDPGSADVQALVTHEWGHAIGCDHVPLRASTMYFSAVTGQISLRTLAPDDRALIGSAYPNDAFATTTGTLRGRVDVAGAKDDRAAHVVAVSVGSGEPAASALTLPDGTFEIRGLPRGAYRVLAAPTVPLAGAMNAFWTAGSASFLPAVAVHAEGNPAEAAAFRVWEQADVDVGTLAVARTERPLEPNDSPDEAVPLRIGDAAAARLESSADADWYAFDVLAGERLSMKVLAWEIGSNADPQLRLADPDGNTITRSFDIRDSSSLRGIDGDDRDAAIGPWTAPADGRYLLRVGADKPSSDSHDFYVLHVTYASDAPSPRLTTGRADPDRIDAGGVATTQLVVTPRREDGEPVGPGATVELAHSGQGTVGPVTDRGDGTYAATVTSSAARGRDTFTAVVTTPLGVATADDVETVVYVGPVSTATSSLTAIPRRISADGASASQVRFVPRDADGEALGSRRSASLSFDGQTGATLGAVEDVGDGAYTADVTAPSAPGTVHVEARLDAAETVASVRVAFGFALVDVLTDAEADVAAFAATPELPKRAVSALGVAAKRVESAQAKAGGASASRAAERAALSRTRVAMAAVQGALARAKGRLADRGTSRDLALAIRETADAAIGRVVIRTGRDQLAVDAARSRLGAGDDKAAAGDWAAAAAAWLKAYRTVFSRL